MKWLAVAAISMVCACGNAGGLASGTDESSTGTGSTSVGETSGPSTSTSTSPTSTTSTSTDGGGSITHGFVPEPDIPPDACDLFEQNCPEGKKCYPIPMDPGTSCIPAPTDPQPEGAPCTRDDNAHTDNCDVGLFCWRDTCRPTCDPMVGHSTCTGMCDRCIGLLHPTIGEAAFCETTCDPIAQDCPSGFACYASMMCSRSGSLSEGEPCQASNSCAPGLVCLDTARLAACADAKCCTRLCSLADTDPCLDASGGDTCHPLIDGGSVPPCANPDAGVCSMA